MLAAGLALYVIPAMSMIMNPSGCAPRFAPAPHGYATMSMEMGARSSALTIDMLSDDDFENVVIAASATKPVLVDFVADFCGPCKLIEPLLRNLNSQGEVKVLKANADNAPRFKEWLAKQGRQISVLPTCVLFEGGEMKRTLVGGFNAAKLQAFLGEAVKGVVRSTATCTPAPALQPIPVLVENHSPHERWSRNKRGL